MKPTNYKNLALAGITAAVLTACSSGGTCGTCAIPVPATGSKLIFVAPSILPSLANTTGINYMGVYNPTTTAISNISYSLGQAVGTGSSVTLDPASAKICANIAAKSSCFLKLSVPESTIAGGAVVTASNSDGTEAATPLAIGVQQVPYGESANANGVGLYFYPKAQYSESGVPFMLATAVVQSPNVGNINSIEIVDESGNLIADQYVTSGNSGVGAAPLTMGSVVEIMLPLPKGVNLSQNYKVRTSYQSAPSTLSTIAEKLGLANKQTQATSNQTTGTQVYTVTTQGNNINLQFTPSQVYLTGKNPVQYGYLYNIGDLTASQIQVSSSSPNVRVTAADQILNGQRVIKVTYELINTTVAPASNIVTVTAQNPAGQTQTSTGNTNQNVSPDVVPTPSPTPTPTPTPSPAPAPGPAPQLSSEVPVDAATNVSLAASISITFDEPMDLTTLIAANFQLQKVSGSSFVTLANPVYSSDGKTVTFVTSSGTANPALVSSSQYKIIIPTPANIKSASGTALNLPSDTYPNGVISTFTTGNVTQCSPEGGGWAGILNSSNNSFTKCLWQTDGSFYNCTGDGTAIGLFSTPSVILFDGVSSLYEANSGSNSLAYYVAASYTSSFAAPSPLYGLTAPAISGAAVAYNIYKGFVFVNTTGGLNICGINTGTGALTGCAAANPTGLSADAYGSGFSSDGTANGIFWVTNKNSNTISACPASSDNPTVITQCNDAGGSKFNQPTAIYATNSYVLVTNSGDNTIVRCDQSSGVLSNCVYTGGNINGPSSIVAGQASASTLYITNLTDNSVTFCKNSNGVLSNCNRMVYPAGTFTAPSGIFVSNTCNSG